MLIERFVHIVDDDAPVRRSLQRLLQTAGFATAAYETPFACLDAAPRLKAGCLLLDVRMPGMDGLQLQAELIKRGVGLPIIVMTGHADVQTAVRAMKGGAIDFIEKPFASESLIAALETAMADVGPAARKKELNEAAARIATLSPRERQVLERLVTGQPNKVIAFDLGLSTRTVELHRARMLKRLGLRRLAEAIRLAILAALL
jgi:two-component system response regulator FixJ